MSNFRERPLRLGLQAVIASEPVGGLRPGTDWIFMPWPKLTFRATMDGAVRTLVNTRYIVRRIVS